MIGPFKMGRHALGRLRDHVVLLGEYGTVVFKLGDHDDLSACEHGLIKMLIRTYRSLSAVR